MDNDQPSIDRFDSSIELNRTWYFERFSSINSDELNSGEELSNQSKFFTHLDKNLNRNNLVAKLVNQHLGSEKINLNKNVYLNLFQPKDLISSTYEELTSNLSKFTNRNAEDSLFSNSTILPPSSSSSFINSSSSLLETANSTNSSLQPILITEDSVEDGTFWSQLFVTNLSSIQSLINDDQMYLVLNSSNASTLTNSTFSNSTTFIQTFDEQLNTTLNTDTQPHYNWIYIIVVFLIIFGVLGNCLVCLAICIEKRLQNATNYFLLSLAICDLLVCCLVMPFLMFFDFYGYWPYGTTLCNFWVTCDVLLCTSSIIHLLFISVTRYIGITHPLTGSIVSFFLAMLIMVNTYVLTIRLLKRKAKLCQENASLQQQSNGTRPSAQCKVLVQDSSKRNNSKSSISSDYSTGLGATTVKESDYITQNTQSRTTEKKYTS